jgi:hypothetical protein
MSELFNERPKVFKWIVGLIPLLASVAIMGLLFFVAIPDANKDTLLPLAGVFFGWGGAVVSYEFGAVSQKNAIKQVGSK